MTPLQPPSRADAAQWRGEFCWRLATALGALAGLHPLRQAIVSSELFPLGSHPKLSIDWFREDFIGREKSFLGSRRETALRRPGNGKL
jgi:hypothetical protein